MALIKDVMPGDRLIIGEITINVAHKSGSHVRLVISAPRSEAVIHEKVSPPRVPERDRNPA